MAYDGFISYSHAADGRLAPALQRGLQRLAKPWNSRRALRIFRDETGLSTNPDLWSSIEEALDESSWFILLASPDSAGSEWVNKEITRWLETKSVERILPVVTDGTWEWDQHHGDFTARSSAVPTALRGALRDEPRHLDLRWARAEIDLDLRNSRFRGAVADLAAPVHGVAKDELEGEDIRQHRRTRMLARGAVGALAVLLLVAVGFGVIAALQRNDANRNANEAHQELLVAESQAQLSSNRQLGTLLAIEADRRDPSAATKNALVNAILAEPSLQRTFGAPVSDVAALANDRVAVLSNNRGTSLNRDVLQIWNWRTGRQEPWKNAPLGDANSGPVDISTTTDGSLLAVLSRDGMIQLYSGVTLNPLGSPFASNIGPIQRPVLGRAPLADIALSSNGLTLAVDNNGDGSLDPNATRVVSVFSRTDFGWTPDPPLGGSGGGAVGSISLSSDGSEIATLALAPSGSAVAVYDVRTGARLVSFDAVSASYVALDWPARRVVLSANAGGLNDAVWYDLESPDPTPNAINVGSEGSGGDTLASFEPNDTVLGISSENGLGIFKEASLGTAGPTSVLPTGTFPGPFLFLNSNFVLTATFETGPMSVWNLAGTSVLATPTMPKFNFVEPTSDPDRLLGYSTFGDDSFVSVLDRNYRPLGGPIPVNEGAQGNSPNVLADFPLACLDARDERIATVAFSTGSIVIRNASSPFRVLGTANGILGSDFDPDFCAWSPSGRYIAVGSYPQGNQEASVAVYDLKSQGLVANSTLNDDEIAITSLVWNPDSKSLLVGGPTASLNGVYRMSKFGMKPQVRVAFPGGFAVSAITHGSRIVVAYQAALEVFEARGRAPLTPRISVLTTAIIEVQASSDGGEALVASPTAWRLIDLGTRQPSTPWMPMYFPSLSFLAADGTTVFSQGPGGSGEIWDLSPAHLRAVACGLAGRNLTAQEWQEYLSWAGPRRVTCPEYPLSQ